MTRRFPRTRLWADARGVALTEFALTMPFFLLLLLGIYDFSWQLYGKSVLSGAVTEAARAATLEGNNTNQSAIDDKVESQVTKVFKHADVEFTRQSYDDFSDADMPEDYTDNNSNGRRDPGECFEDANANGSWDEDRARDGNGNAGDVVLYTASMTIDRVLPVWRMMGQSQSKTISASSILRNQPFAADTDATVVVCT